MGKKRFYQLWLAKTFVKPLLIVDLLAGLLAIIFGAIIYYHPTWGGTMNVLLWAIPLSVFVVAIVVGFLCAPYYTYKELERKRDGIQSELNQIKDARPNIELVGTENIKTAIRNVRTGEILGEPVFTQVKFANNPATPLQAVDAPNVAAHIEILDKSGHLLFNMIGRWSETKEEALGARPPEMEQISIPANGRPNPLDIVLKYHEDHDCYGHNNTSRRLAPNDWRDEEKKLPVGTYFVEVHLQGSNVDKVFSYGFVNRGPGTDIELMPFVAPFGSAAEIREEARENRERYAHMIDQMGSYDQLK